MNYGTAAFVVTKHDDKVSKVEVLGKEIKAKPQDNSDAGSIILQDLKNAVDEGFEGERTFTVEISGGTVKLVTMRNTQKET